MISKKWLLEALTCESSFYLLPRIGNPLDWDCLRFVLLKGSIVTDVLDEEKDALKVLHVGLLHCATGGYQVMVSDHPALILLANHRREFSLARTPALLDTDSCTLYTDEVRSAFTANLGYALSPRECTQRIEEFIQALMQSGVDRACNRHTNFSSFACVLGEKPYICLKEHAPVGCDRIDVPSAIPMLFSLQSLMALPDEDGAIAHCLGMLFLKGIGLVDTVHVTQLVEA